MPTAKSQVFSAALHIGLLLFFLVLSYRSVRPPVPPTPAFHVQKLVLPFEPFLIHGPAHIAGGANRGDAPARRGVPPPAARKPFVPPELRPAPKLPLEVAVTFEAPDIRMSLAQFGDPYGVVQGQSLGSGGKHGIGDGGCCGGTGPGHDGAPGVSSYRDPHLIPAALVYKIEPEFSEEARKAKFQGTVVLSIEIDASGHAKNIHVVSSPGLGLDQKAVDAVVQWRFRPAQSNGRAVASNANIEVNFHLL